MLVVHAVLMDTEYFSPILVCCLQSYHSSHMETVIGVENSVDVFSKQIHHFWLEWIL